PGTRVASSRGYLVDADYVRYRLDDPSPTRWAGLASGDPPVLQFWYRESPQPLASTHRSGRVSSTNPPLFVSGMVGVRLAPNGRRTAFYRVPPQLGEAVPAGPPGAPDWRRLFVEAGLDLARFRPVEPQWTPPLYCDARAAWEGFYGEGQDLKVRIETAAYRGEPVWFQVVAPWTRPDRGQPFRFTPAEALGQPLPPVALLYLPPI